MRAMMHACDVNKYSENEQGNQVKNGDEKLKGEIWSKFHASPALREAAAMLHRTA
jgi:hypothetical protein